MKVLDLQCSHQHSFEGWFGSEDDFQGQLARGLIECPLCADKGIQKLPSAPRLNFGARQPHDAPDTAKASSFDESTALTLLENSAISGTQAMQNAPSVGEQADFLHALRRVIKKTEDVGPRFAEEARRMHYGEAEARSIRGQASVRQAVELLEEGIDVMPFPMLPSLKETLQ